MWKGVKSLARITRLNSGIVAVTLVAVVLGHKTPTRPGSQREWGQGGNHSSQQKVPQGQDPAKKSLGSTSAPSGAPALPGPRHQFFGQASNAQGAPCQCSENSTKQFLMREGGCKEPRVGF